MEREPTITKLGRSLDALHEEDLASITFGVLLLYRRSPVGDGADRAFPPTMGPEARDAVSAVSTRRPDKDLIVLGLDKVYRRHLCGIRAREESYMAETSTVTGFLYRDGKLQEEAPMYKNPDV